MRRMELTELAARALAAVRRDGRDLRFEVTEICHSSRFRLSVHYLASAGAEQRVGLLYSEDRDGLESLRSRLAAGEAGR